MVALTTLSQMGAASFTKVHRMLVCHDGNKAIVVEEAVLRSPEDCLIEEAVSMAQSCTKC